MSLLLSEDYHVISVAKAKCLRHLSFFTRYFFKTQYKRKFIVSHHHEVIFAALERVLTGKCIRLIINIPPRYGKTELAVKNFIPHALALNPAAKFIHLSYSDDLALDNSETVKNLIQSDEYQKLFPHVQIKRDAKAKDKWWTTDNGGVLARAAGGQVTGFGAGLVDLEEDEIDSFLGEQRIALPDKDDFDLKFEFNGAIIIDDPIKPEDANQDTIREKVNSQFDSTIRTRANSRKTPIIIIMHRLHPRDLVGYLQREDEADKWEVISLPAIQADGSALWPFKHTLDELLYLKKANEIVFENQYQQNAKPKAGLLFPVDELTFFDMETEMEGLEDPDYVFVPADPANEGGDDFAAGVFNLVGDRILLTSVLYNTDGADLNESALATMILENKTSEAAVEATFGWKETAGRVRDDVRDKGYENEFRMLKPRLKKEARILNRSSFIKNHIEFRKDWERYPQYAKFMRNLTSYLRIQEPGRKNKHDDAPDLCEMAGTFFERTFRHLWGYEKQKTGNS